MFKKGSFIASDWIYSNFIEANGERDATGTGIGLGAGTGFTDAAADVIQVITGGAVRVQVANTLTKGLDFVKVLPRFVEIADVTYDHNSRELSIDYSINFADILRTNPSPEAMEDSDEY